MGRYQYDQNLFKYFSQMERKFYARPLNLGGSPYGLGSPAGGFVGYLPQNRVSYDTDELESDVVPASGISLIDNMNHIRYRLNALEVGGITFQEDDITVASGVTIANFEGGVTVTDNGGNKVTIDIAGSLTDEKVKISANDTTSNYLLSKIAEGTGITITEVDDGGNEQVEITCTVSGELVKVSANDTTSGYLNGKLVAGTGITLNELTDGGNETLRVDCTVTASGITGEVEFKIPIDGFGKGAAKPSETVLGDWVGYAFSINDLGYFSFEVPLDWDEVSDIDVALHWYIDEAYATRSGEVRFAAIATIRKEDGTEVVDSGTYSYNGSDMNIPATAKALAEYEISIPAADIALHDVIGFQIKRIALVGGTNPTAEPVIVGMEAEYIRKLGAIGTGGDMDMIAIQVFG